MSSLFTTSAPVLGFHIWENEISLLSGKDLFLIDKSTGSLRFQNRIFEKDGSARFIKRNGSFIAVSDFCDLHLFSRETGEKVAEWKLGNDLTSDICGLHMDEAHVYASIRNGKIVRINLKNLEQTEYIIGERSAWALGTHGDLLMAGTVGGELLFFEKHAMKPIKTLVLSKQNLRSLYSCGNTLYIAGQDKSISAVDLETFALKAKKTGIHSKMFDIAGVSEGKLYTVCHPACEIGVLDESFHRIACSSFALRLSGSSSVNGEYLYFSSRNIHGIERLPLAEIGVKQ